MRVTAERLCLEIGALVGPDHVIVDPDSRASYEVDWTGRHRGAAAAVVRPGSTAEVAAVLRWCGEHDHVVVPQGGNTGLVGGGVPRSEPDDDRPTVVISLRRLGRLGPVDPTTMQVTAGAGVTLAGLRDHARAAGLDVPVDFAARDTATVGGAIATNAGGSRVVRFGTMRAQLVGVEALLASGHAVGSLAGLPKETAGLHWPSLLAGSEGTLAVVTAARLRLVPWYRRTATALVAVESTDDAVRLLAAARDRLASLDAVEMIRPRALELVAGHLGVPPPVEVPSDGSVVVVDCAAHDDPTDELVDLLSSGEIPIVDSAVAGDPTRREALLAFRDRITEAIAAASAATGVPTFKLDVAVPVERLGELLTRAEAAADDDGCRLVTFGHLAEGNVHLNHLGARDPDVIAARVLAEVAALGGTISAEHGIGVAKSRWLGLVRDPADLAAQRAVKLALDPRRVLNPGVLGR